MSSVSLRLEPGEVAYFELGGREYALACRPSAESSLLPSDSGRSLPESGRYQVRHLSDDLPAGYEIRAKDELFFVYFQGREIGWSADRNGAQGLIEHDLSERSSRARFIGSQLERM